MTNPEEPSDHTKSEDQKVYCNKCKSFTKRTGMMSTIYKCKSPNNCFPTWEDPCGWKKLPSEINDNNDCSWYDPIDGKLMVSWIPF